MSLKKICDRKGCNEYIPTKYPSGKKKTDRQIAAQKHCSPRCAALVNNKNRWGGGHPKKEEKPYVLTPMDRFLGRRVV
jgi:hypothetical protein